MTTKKQIWSPKKAWGEGHEMTIITKGKGKLSGKKEETSNKNKGKILARLSRGKKKRKKMRGWE